ncbi:GNAT family N-acetyltransferase [Mucilaginibacter sp. RS28]|uniref:GNAT family N-acetyltransferase n=1 Tax=Mucilaginibacter straminoryzae TaxID=2932774 RepID=A0A9X2B903_9SPHI|nr:GNAT family N-acetyltransferase [Mucilaginibacter straminoryzae]MCJ8210119.1 GNAT family N-acetyltransferase [Mucilaginibacter straminoryzae]
MEHVLDNPAWNALISTNSTLADGFGAIRYFDKAVSPFVGMEVNNEENFRKLYEAVPHEGPFLFMSVTETEIPSFWSAKGFVVGWQMVYEGSADLEKNFNSLTLLNELHVPQMLELTKLTNPGPFNERTINFGNYYGVLVNDTLAAMAGQRLQPFDYTEISAVCTHPDHLGNGYATQLLTHQIQLITQVGKTPFLHVRNDNQRAIDVYQRLGFTIRKPAYFYVLVKDKL